MKTLLKLRSECLDPDLGQVFLAFDKYCDENSIKYSIECDERNEQSYLVLKHDHRIDGLIDYMKQFIEGRSVVMDIDRKRREGVLFYLSTKPIVDCTNKSTSIEDKIKSPTTKMINDQSAFPQSYSDTKSFGGITKKHYMKKTKKFSDKLDDRLDSITSEEVIGLTAPEVLVTLTGNGPPPSDGHGTRTVVYTIQASENDHNIIDGLIKSLENGGNGITGSVRVSKNEPGSQPIIDSTEIEPEIQCEPLEDLNTKLSQLLNMDIGA